MVSEVFFKAQVARILGIQETSVKNWTIGRPLQIHPHRSGLGKGSRNMYDIIDLYRFSLAHQLSLDGFAPRAIQSILDELGTEFGSLKFVLVTSEATGRQSNRPKLKFQRISPSQFESEQWDVISPLSDSFGAHVLHIAALIQDVDHRVERFVLKAFGRRAPGQSAPQTHVVEGSTHLYVPSRKFRTLTKD